MSEENTKEVFRRQQQEMKQVESELLKARTEYLSVCTERGTAHKYARLYSRQEQDIQEFEKRRDKMVEMRAKKVAQIEANKVAEREKRKNQDKLDQSKRRKELLHTDWSPKKNPEASRSIANQALEDELRRLSLLEKQLETKIQNKKLAKAKTPVPKDVEVVHQKPKKVPQDNKSKYEDDPLFIGYYGPPKHQKKVDSDATKSPKRDSGFNDEIDPDAIAKNVFLKLQKLKELATRVPQVESRKKPAPEKVFKETAVNTTLHAKDDSRRSTPEEETYTGSIDSKATSYKSLPHDIIRNRDMEKVLDTIRKQKVAFSQTGNTRRIDLIPEEEVVHALSSPPARSPSPTTIDMCSDDPSSILVTHEHERSQFWRDVFDAAGVSFNDEMAEVLHRLKHTHDKSIDLENGFEKVLEEMTLLSVKSLDKTLNETLNQFLHSTPRKNSNFARGLDDEKELTLVGSFNE